MASNLGYAFDAVLVALALADVHVVYVVLVEDDLRFGRVEGGVDALDFGCSVVEILVAEGARNIGLVGVEFLPAAAPLLLMA